MDYKYKKRIADIILQKKLKSSGAVLVEGPKWCGKTTTSEQHAKSVNYVSDPMNFNKNQILAEMNINALLEGEKPKLLDEWQVIPQLWDAVRFAVDHSKGIGQFIMTGSAVPPDEDRQQKMLSAIRQSLDCDEPIMIAEVFKQGGAHAILAIGYEERNNEITKLFCLDPGSAIPCNAYWNMVIIINQNPNSKYSHISIDSDNRSSDVYVDETLIIKRK